MAPIDLIGTIHDDLNGPRRLETALNAERPTILTVEASEQSVEFLAKREESCRQKVLQICRESGISEQRIASEEEQLRRVLGYEHKVCRTYAEKNSIPLHLIDEPSVVGVIKRIRKKRLRTLKKLACAGLLYLETNERHMRQRDKLYGTIERLFAGNHPEEEQELIDAYRASEKGVFGKRDKIMAKNLSLLTKNHPSAKIVHVGGLAHLLDDAYGETLYARLKELRPMRTTLLYYDV